MTSPQPPQKDFLALTHGQEWVTFYESFDLLVQDHLSRSSDLLRRAMSLPEVADREVAQVRDDLEGKLAAERERTNALLTDLKTQIDNSHRLASTLASSIGSLMTDLHSLGKRVDEAIQSSSQVAPTTTPAPTSPPVAPTGLLGSAPSTAAGFGAAPATPATGNFAGSGSTASSPSSGASVAATGDESISFRDASTGFDARAFEAVVGLADEPVMDVADLAEGADAGDQSAIDLTAIAEAEASSADASNEHEANVDASDTTGEGEASSESGERQRPHWLSVTRVGATRP